MIVPHSAEIGVKYPLMYLWIWTQSKTQAEVTPTLTRGPRLLIVGSPVRELLIAKTVGARPL